MRPVASTELADHLLSHKPHLFDPYRGTNLAEDTPQPFIAAQMGLEPHRYCALCGRRMVTQVMPTGWRATCSRHGTISSYLFEH